jgi:hypothetical protein
VWRSYCAFAIGPEELAISVYEFDAADDVEALNKAAPLFHDRLKRIDVWCGSRKGLVIFRQCRTTPPTRGRTRISIEICASRTAQHCCVDPSNWRVIQHIVSGCRNSTCGIEFDLALS